MAQSPASALATMARAPRMRWGYVIGLVLLVLVVWSVYDSGLSVRALLGGEGRRQMALFVQQMFPPDLSPALLRKVWQGALETLAISFLGTLLAITLSAVLLGGATRTLGASTAFGESVAMPLLWRLGHALLYYLCRALLNLFRSVPELIWALLFILAVGLGPFAGVLALGVHTAGVLGRLFAEVLENVDHRPCETLQAAGATRAHVFLYGMLPQALPDLLSFALYR
jgi:phosphonate transport system permease protein